MKRSSAAAKASIFYLRSRGVAVENTVAPSHDYESPLVPVIGTQITGTAGTWTGNPTLTYQWFKVATQTNTGGTEITDATSLNYTPVDADSVFGMFLYFIEIPNGDTDAAVASAATGAVVYEYLYDDFTTLEAAPVASPRTAEPGPGELTITQTGGNISIVAPPSGAGYGGNVMRLPTPGAAAYNSVAVKRETGQARAAGLAFVSSIFRTVATGIWSPGGWRNATGLPTATNNAANAGVFFIDAVALNAVNGGVVLATGINMPFTNTPVMFAVVANADGFDFYGLGGEWNEWTLLWSSMVETSATLYEYFGVRDTTMDVDEVYTRRFGTLNTEDALTASPSDATTYAAPVNGYYRLTLTSPAVLTEEAGLVWNYTDANNYFRAYFTTSGELAVEKYIAGVRTELLAPVAGVLGTPPKTRTIAVRKDGDVTRVYSFNAATPTLRATITDSALQLTGAVRADLGSGWTGANLLRKPIRTDAYAPLGTVQALADNSSVLTLDGRRYIAFPDLVVLPNGDLFCIYRNGTSHVGGTTATIEYRIKKDGADVWNAPVTLQAAATRTSPQVWQNVWCSVIGTRLIVFVMEYETEGNMSTWVRYSDDNGATFSAKSQITSTSLDSTSNYQHGRIVELGDGTLLTCLWGVPDGGVSGDEAEVVVIESADDGATWTERAHLDNTALGSIHCSEPEIILTSDDTLLMVVRGLGATLFFTSADDGETWVLSDTWAFQAGDPHLYRHTNNQMYLFTRDTTNGGELVRYAISNDGTTRTGRTVIDTYSGTANEDGGYCAVAWDGTALRGVYYRQSAHQADPYIAYNEDMLA